MKSKCINIITFSFFTARLKPNDLIKTDAELLPLHHWRRRFLPLLLLYRRRRSEQVHRCHPPVEGTTALAKNHTASQREKGIADICIACTACKHEETHVPY